ncbi:MAG: hypothetical protein WCD76_06735 [Pyrinomonadaceae bacterium]
MADDRESAIVRARADLAARLGVAAGEIKEESVEDADFPDASLGAPVRGEMSGMMITPGWRIRLRAAGHVYEYRANRNQLRLFKYKGTNFKL